MLAHSGGRFPGEAAYQRIRRRADRGRLGERPCPGGSSLRHGQRERGRSGTRSARTCDGSASACATTGGTKGLTQEALAQSLDLSVAYVRLIERGGRNPPYTTVRRHRPRARHRTRPASSPRTDFAVRRRRRPAADRSWRSAPCGGAAGDRSRGSAHRVVAGAVAGCRRPAAAFPDSSRPTRSSSSAILPATALRGTPRSASLPLVARCVASSRASLPRARASQRSFQ